MDRVMLEQALALWGAGERRVRQPTTPARRAAADRALATAVAHLGRADTVEALLAAYFDGPVAPREDWLDANPCAAGRDLDLAAVEDAAYWRRTQQLLHGAPPGQAAPEMPSGPGVRPADYAQATSR